MTEEEKTVEPAPEAEGAKPKEPTPEILEEPKAEDAPREQESVETAPKASLAEPPPSDAEVAPWAGS